jgi:hypothetical protein
MTIDEYLAELERRLPSTRKRRFLSEAEAHLRDAERANRLRGLDPETAEREAVASFGDAELVAQRLAVESAPIAARRATAIALLAILALFLPVYGIPENTLPPAEWAVKPPVIAALQGVTIVCWLLAIALGIVAVVLSLVQPPRIAAAALIAATAAVGALFVSSVALVVAWLAEAPSTLWPLVGLTLPVAAFCLVACAGATLWARDQTRVPGRAPLR